MIDRISSIQDASARHHAESYFTRFSNRLKALSDELRMDLYREVESHFLEQLENGSASSFQEVDNALDRLGDVDELADDYLAAFHSDRLKRQFRPTDMTVVLAGVFKKGVTGLIVGLSASVLNAIAVIALVLGLTDIVFPNALGLFQNLSDQSYTLGTRPDGSNVEELMGWRFTPVMLGVSLISYGLAVMVLSLLAPKSGTRSV